MATAKHSQRHRWLSNSQRHRWLSAAPRRSAAVERLLSQFRPRFGQPMSAAELRGAACVAATFLAVAVPLAVLAPGTGHAGIAVVVLFVALYAVCSRIEFDIAFVSGVPTQLVHCAGAVRAGARHPAAADRGGDHPGPPALVPERKPSSGADAGCGGELLARGGPGRGVRAGRPAHPALVAVAAAARRPGRRARLRPGRHPGARVAGGGTAAATPAAPPRPGVPGGHLPGADR